jgi:hypothetical protein
MSEFLRRHYLKEEDFLDEFQDVAYVAARLLRGDWQPDVSCDDRTREERDDILGSGQLDDLVFQNAAVYDTPNRMFSSAQITLRSSRRLVSVRVRDVDGHLLAEKTFDKPG